LTRGPFIVAVAQCAVTGIALLLCELFALVIGWRVLAKAALVCLALLCVVLLVLVLIMLVHDND
jgi:hypothetical protein